MSIRKLLLLGGVLFAFSSVSHATGASLESDIRGKTIVLHSTWSVAAVTSTNTILISISSSAVSTTTGNFGMWPNPTQEFGYINITNLSVFTDKLAASSATVKLGVVTYVDTSSGSVRYFYSMPSSINVSNSVNNATFDSDESFYNLKVIPPSGSPNLVDGFTPYLMSNDVITFSTAFQSDVTLPAPNIANSGTGGSPTGNAGNIVPGIGDVILSVQNLDAAQAIRVAVDLHYHYMAR